MGMKEWINLVMLSCNAIQDLRKREIFLLPTFGFAAAGILWMILKEQKDITAILTCAVPGLLLLILAFLTSGKVGCGDGIVLLSAGIWSGFPQALYVFMGALFPAAVIAGILLLSHSRIRSIPLVPFFLIAQLLCYLAVK